MTKQKPRDHDLHGGQVTGAVRIGNTVRKKSEVWTPTIHAVLRHLRSEGLPVPEPLGFDEAGREILTFIPGEAALNPWPEALRNLHGVREVGRLLRQIHDAMTRFLPPQPSIWRFGERTPKKGEIVCHNDFGPYNLIWRGGALVGVINWDFAFPGEPIGELAFAAWIFAPLRPDDLAAETGLIPPYARKERLMALLGGYGFEGSTSDILDLAKNQRMFHAGYVEDMGAKGIEPWAAFLKQGAADRHRREWAWLNAHYGELAR